MFKDLHVAHLTGSAKVLRNNYFSDEIEWRPRRTVGQMFFRPYESKEEFIFCARNTVQPLILLGLGFLAPMALALTVNVFLGVSLGLVLTGAIYHCLGYNVSADWCCRMAEELVSRLWQAVINLIVLPLTAIALVTRGISTGLKAAEIYDYSKPEEPAVGVHTEDETALAF